MTFHNFESLHPVNAGVPTLTPYENVMVVPG